MNITAECSDYFVTRVWRFQLQELQQFHEQWLDLVNKLRQASPTPDARRSTRNGWKTPYDLFKRKEFEVLQHTIQECTRYIFKQMAVDPTLKFKVNGSVNITDPEGYNRQHGHSNTLFVGCYYLQVPENSGDICFTDPRPAAKYAPLSCASNHGSSNINISPREGDLLMFPSWLEHSVETNESSESRISIPVNIDSV